MCGIAGFIGDFSPDILHEMKAAIAHRGPDGQGVSYDPDLKVGFAHTRLAIIDLSESGHQPMKTTDGQIEVVFNGEIYNFQELRAELQQSGHIFTTGTDTEVLLHGWREWQEQLFHRIQGIYAFALLDRKHRRFLLVRDPLGIKPLYWSVTSAGLLFGSEMKAILAPRLVDTTVNTTALAYHLALLWCPAPLTILQSIQKLEPGYVLEWKQGQPYQRQFYTLPFGSPHDLQQEDRAASAIRQTLNDCVQRQLISDAPVGAFLSGGLDSSSIVSAAVRLSGKPIPCYTIDLSSQSEGFTDDLPYARKVAHTFGCPLHVIQPVPISMQRLEFMVHHLEEPQADPAPLHVYDICKMARDHGVKVLLSGSGGDDIFSGYRRHIAVPYHKTIEHIPVGLRRLLQHGVSHIPQGHPWLRRVTKLLRDIHLPFEQRIIGLFLWLDEEHVASICKKFASARERLNQTLLHHPKRMAPLDQILLLECTHFLADHNLLYTDKLSMATGVEVRVPLIDTQMVALAARIAPELKVHQGQAKWIFKRAMESELPKEVIYRPKTGFGSPLRRWLHEDMRESLYDLLSPATLRRRGLLQEEAVTQLLNDDYHGRIDAAYPLFGLACFEIWCRLFLDNASVPTV